MSALASYIAMYTSVDDIKSAFVSIYKGQFYIYVLQLSASRTLRAEIPRLLTIFVVEALACVPQMARVVSFRADAPENAPKKLICPVISPSEFVGRIHKHISCVISTKRKQINLTTSDTRRCTMEIGSCRCCRFHSFFWPPSRNNNNNIKSTNPDNRHLFPNNIPLAYKFCHWLLPHSHSNRIHFPRIN